MEQLDGLDGHEVVFIAGGGGGDDDAGAGGACAAADPHRRGAPEAAPANRKTLRPPVELAIGPNLLPMHMAVDGQATLRIAAGGDSAIFIKTLHAETRDEIDCEGAILAARRAGEIGVGPRLLRASAEAGCLVFEALAGYEPLDARTATDRGVRRRMLALLRRWHEAGMRVSQITPSELAAARLDTLNTHARDWAPLLPEGWPELAERISLLIARLARSHQDPVPLHGENALSNFLFDGEGRLRMVDYERGLWGDRMYDVGALALETGCDAAEMTEFVRLYDPAADAAETARAALCALLDDFLWGAWGLIRHRQGGPGGEVEFFKFARYRLTRCRHHLAAWPVDAWLEAVR